MDAPNKVYVEVCDDGIFAFPEPPFYESVEYIRADLVEQPLQQEQPEVDLEKEIDKYFHENLGFIISSVDTRIIVEHIARHFAEWQREQDSETIELAEDHAMLAGMVKEREKILKAAVDGEVVSDLKGVNYVRSMSKIPDDLRFGKKVKLIIIKEEYV